jgi:glycosyltransferase involved in cell wall biosynthesis
LIEVTEKKRDGLVIMKPKICFVSLGSYPLFSSNENLQYMGGAELMQVLVGNELAKKGYDISFITLNEKGEKKKDFEKITIIKSYSPSQNFLKKIFFLGKSIIDSDSNIIIQSGGIPGIIALFCFLLQKKYIKWIASDRNVLLQGIERKSIYSKISQYVDIKIAFFIVAQNEFQKQIVENKFKKHCIVIKNPIPIHTDLFSVKDTTTKEKTVLWVGTIRTIKQPELFLKLAQMLPNYKFKMIGGRDDVHPEFYDVIEPEAKKIFNLEFLGFVPYYKIDKYYKESSILVNTSAAEGFPNTFLEAGLHSLPIVSLNADPDEIICTNHLGYHSKTFDQMIIDVDTLLKNKDLRDEMGKNARKYVEDNHDLNKITDQFDRLFSSLGR